MPNSKEPNHFLFYAIATNPYLQSLQKALSAFFPDAQWWMIDAEKNIVAFPGQMSKSKGESFQKTPPEDLKTTVQDVINNKRQNGTPHLNDDEMLQGFVRFQLNGEFAGGIAINNVHQKHKDLLRHALYALEGYLALLSGSLENHDDLERLHDLWTDTISIIDQKELLERLTQELCKSLNLKNGMILLINEDGEFYPSYSINFPEELLKQRNINITRYDYMDHLPQSTKVMQDVPQNDPLRLWLTNSLEALGADEFKDHHYCYVVPFYRMSFLIGVFLTISDHEYPYSETKENMARILAIGGAAALDNALTLERMNQRRKALSTIHVVHRLISTTITINELLPKIAQLTRQLLDVRKCSIMLYEPREEQLNPKVALGMEPDEVSQRPLRLGEELPGWVAENFNPVVYHPAEVTKPGWHSTGAAYPSESYLAVALFDTDIEGVITVAEKQGNFSPGDREILVTFAEQAILAIKNARTHEGERTITINALKSIANLIETHDPSTPGVTTYTSQWAQTIGEYMHLNERDMLNVTYGALLRDTGMLRTLQATFSIQEHRQRGPQLSLKFVQSLGLSEDVGLVVYHANEAWNGKGYPNQLKGNDIPLASRIIAVANAFVTLLNKWNCMEKPKPQDLQKALKIITRLSGRTFDPDVVHTLQQVVQNSKREEK